MQSEDIMMDHSGAAALGLRQMWSRSADAHRETCDVTAILIWFLWFTKYGQICTSMLQNNLVTSCNLYMGLKASLFPGL